MLCPGHEGLCGSQLGEWACMYICVGCVVSRSEYKDAFSFYWVVKTLRKPQYFPLSASVGHKLLIFTMHTLFS